MNKIFCLMGPTGSGKTDLAIKLVQQFPLEIISVDSAMIYQDMDIGTAKPTAEELALAPHHLIDKLNPSQSYSAAAFCKDVETLLPTIYRQKKYPLLVGGTMMYFHALQHGLSQLPEADSTVRQTLQEAVLRDGWEILYARLKACDPETAARIHAHDTQRILRALEVYMITGKPLSSFYSAQKSTVDATFFNLALFPENRAWLHQRIAQRFDKMLDAGLIEEVQHLQSTWNLDASFPSMRSVGYRQVLSFLAGEYDYQQLREKGVAATRQLAKRQLTWLRSFENIWRVDPGEAGYENTILEWFEKNR